MHGRSLECDLLSGRKGLTMCGNLQQQWLISIAHDQRHKQTASDCVGRDCVGGQALVMSHYPPLHLAAQSSAVEQEPASPNCLRRAPSPSHAPQALSLKWMSLVMPFGLRGAFLGKKTHAPRSRTPSYVPQPRGNIRRRHFTARPTKPQERISPVQRWQILGRSRTQAVIILVSIPHAPSGRQTPPPGETPADRERLQKHLLSTSTEHVSIMFLSGREAARELKMAA